ncbi:MAG TPA: hypothetical protein VH968_04195 [Gaiellaceae bacterium]|jgi:hypothetical protein
MSDNEHERIVDDEGPIPIVEGEDEFPVEPAPPLDPYTPDTGPGPGEERAYRVLRLAWLPLGVAAILILIALLR